MPIIRSWGAISDAPNPHPCVPRFAADDSAYLMRRAERAGRIPLPQPRRLIRERGEGRRTGNRGVALRPHVARGRAGGFGGAAACGDTHYIRPKLPAASSGAIGTHAAVVNSAEGTL